MDSTKGWSWSNPDLTPEPKRSGPRPRQLGLITLAIALVAGVFLTLSVIGGNGGPANPVAQAAEQTTSNDGARFDISASAPLPTGSTIAMSGSGALNFRDPGGEMQIHGQIPGHGSLQIRYVFTAGGFFMSSPQFASLMPEGKSWVRVDMSGSGASTGLGAQEDPGNFMNELKGSADVVELGHERLGNLNTTHYSASVTENGQSDPIDVWVDDQGLLRRLINNAGGTALRLDIYGYGPAPAIAVPPDQSVVDSSQLQQSGLLPS